MKIITFFKNIDFFLSLYNIKMDSKNIRLYKGSGSYFIVDQYQKDTCFYDEDKYYNYDTDADRILLHKSNKKYFIRYRHSNKMDIVPLKLKIKSFYYEIHDYNDGKETIYIENSDDGFFQTIREIWNKRTKLIGIDNAPDFVKYTLDDEEHIKASVIRNTNFVESNCYKDELIIVLHSIVNNNLKASLLELVEYVP